MLYVLWYFMFISWYISWYFWVFLRVLPPSFVVSGGANAAHPAGLSVGAEAPGPAAGRCPAGSSRAWSGHSPTDPKVIQR